MRHQGFEIHPEALDPAVQADLVLEVTSAALKAPFVRPVTPWGKPMSVLQSSMGAVGWITDAKGYRYEPLHPLTGQPWPPMPQILLELWARFSGSSKRPDTCLINLYRGPAKMGLHRDADEADETAPVLSISLGDTAIFRIGGLARTDPTATATLRSGDVAVLAGASRRAYHGVDKVLAGSSRAVPGGGRLSLTLRRAQA